VNVNSPPEHEKLFDEICGKLHELSHQPLYQSENSALSERLENMQVHLRRSQEELKTAQKEIQEKIDSLNTLNFSNNDLSHELKRVSEQLEQERVTNSKMSTDLAKSLEMNLRLQFEIEEARTKSSQSINSLQEKVKNLTHDLELAEALATESKIEHSKAKDKFQDLSSEVSRLSQLNEEKDKIIQDMQLDLDAKTNEIKTLNASLDQYDAHNLKQEEMIRNLSEVAEKKLIELKLALDKKTSETSNYHSHLQQTMTQVHVFRQENAALKDYISKIASLQPPPQQPTA
jgi:chromosome segregation ATPase